MDSASPQQHPLCITLEKPFGAVLGLISVGIGGFFCLGCVMYGSSVNPFAALVP